jgi:glycine amidinotransferase
LRTVVLAQSQMRLPDPAVISPEQLAAEAAIMPDEQRQMMRSLLGRDHAEAMPDRQRAWEAERDALALVFARHGVEVLRPRLMNEWEKAAGGPAGYSNSFVRDPWFCIGNHVIEGSLRFPHRRLEALPSRELMYQEVYPADCQYVAVPQPAIMPLDVDNGGPGPFLEGGDVMVWGQHVFVGESGRASTRLGTEWLRKLLAPCGYVVESVRLKPSFLHLDCVLGMVREGLAVVCQEALPDGLPSAMNGWDLIHATEAEAMNLAANGLPIGPDVYVTDPAFGRIADAIARHGITIELVDFAISRAFGGAFRCSTQPLHRE